MIVVLDTNIVASAIIIAASEFLRRLGVPENPA